MKTALMKTLKDNRDTFASSLQDFERTHLVKQIIQTGDTATIILYQHHIDFHQNRGKLLLKKLSRYYHRTYQDGLQVYEHHKLC